MPVSFPPDLVLEVAKNCLGGTCRRLASGWAVSFWSIQTEANLLRLDYARLRSLCLVSKRVNTKVQPLLYRDVAIRTVIALQAFRRTLVTAPHLGLHCQTFVGTLHEKLNPDSIDEQTKCSIHNLEHLSSKCPNLLVLMFFSSFETRPSSELQHIASRLPVPRYWWAMELPEDVCMKPAPLSATTELSLWLMDPFSDEPVPRPPVNKKSGNLTCVMYSQNKFVYGGRISRQELCDLCSNLTALCITQHLPGDFLQPLINAASSKLQRLCVTNNISTVFTWPFDLIDCTQLQHLTVGVKFQDMLYFFNSLPQQLSELYLEGPLSWKLLHEFTKAMSDRHTNGTYVHLPLLRTFYAKLQHFILVVNPKDFNCKESWPDYLELKSLLELRKRLSPERFEAIRWKHTYFEELPKDLYADSVAAWLDKHFYETKTERDVDGAVKHFHTLRETPSFEDLLF